MTGRRFAAFVGLALVLSSVPSSAQEQRAQPAPKTVFERNSQPIDLFKSGLGTFTRPISSSNKDAQAFFDQGFQMMYAFAKPEAIRSFRESWKRDPNCAICYWGEAWAWGSYLNAPMSPDEAPHAYAAIQKALALKDTHATAKERAFIDATAARYVETFDPAKRVDRDKAYAEAMGRVADTYPDDLEAATLHADALFLLEPRRGTRDVTSPSVRRLHRVLERILAKDYAKLTGDSFYQVLTMIRFGRFDEVLDVKNRPNDELLGGLWDFARGTRS